MKRPLPSSQPLLPVILHSSTCSLAVVIVHDENCIKEGNTTEFNKTFSVGLFFSSSPFSISENKQRYHTDTQHETINMQKIQVQADKSSFFKSVTFSFIQEHAESTDKV